MGTMINGFHQRVVSCALATLLIFGNGGSRASGQPNNPLVPDNLADPEVAQFGDTFYLYSTSDVGDVQSDLAFCGNPVVWKSKDFVHWSFDGICFPSIEWHKKNFFWAPGRAIEKNGRYYLFPTVNGKTRVVRSTTPEGPFSFLSGSPVDASPGDRDVVVHAIDGSPFIDDDGQAYMYWNQNHAAKLSADFTSIIDPVVRIKTKRGGYSEGPFMIKRKGVYYYFCTLGGYADYQYGYMMSRVSPLGPFETPQQDVILKTDLEKAIWGPGHGFAFSPKGSDQWYFLYLEYGVGGTSRQIYANKIEFNADGTIRPIRLDRTGVGPLAAANARKPMDVSGMIASASSVKDPMEVSARPWHDDKELEFVLPRPLPKREHRFEPGCALDGFNDTRWWAGPKDANAWWQLDLGSIRSVGRMELFFVHPTLGHAFVCEKSDDGERWTTVQEQKETAIRSPQVVKNIGLARYLRVRILQGQPGIWEVKLYE